MSGHNYSDELTEARPLSHPAPAGEVPADRAPRRPGPAGPEASVVRRNDSACADARGAGGAAGLCSPAVDTRNPAGWRGTGASAGATARSGRAAASRRVAAGARSTPARAWPSAGRRTTDRTHAPCRRTARACGGVPPGTAARRSRGRGRRSACVPVHPVPGLRRGRGRLAGGLTHRGWGPLAATVLPLSAVGSALRLLARRVSPTRRSRHE